MARLYWILLLVPWTVTALFQPLQQNSSRFRPHRLAAMTSTNELPPPQTFKVLGVCGGIGSGKSSASKLLVSDLGCLAHLDADSIAHSVYSPGSQAVLDIVADFGDEILQENKEIDRKKLGAIVFGDRKEMAKLERLVWPHVKTLLLERIQVVKSEWQQGLHKNAIPVVVLEAAVLLDAEWDDILDGVWVVTTPRQVALQRLQETRGLSLEESQKRIDAQESRRGIGNLEEEVRNHVVTKVIENSGSLEDLTKALHAALRDPKAWK